MKMMIKSQLKKLTNSILYLPANHVTDRPVLAAISGSQRTLFMDAGNSPAHARLLLQGLSSYKIAPPEFVALTHWHWDHIFGMREMKLPAIAHIKTRKQMEKMLAYNWSDGALDERVKTGVEVPFCADMIKKEFAGNREDIQIVLPEILFENMFTVDLGNLTCVIENIGGDHAEDSSIVFVPEEKVLFLGDILAPDLYVADWKFTVDNLLIVLDKIEGYDADIFVESHCEPVNKEQFTEQTDRLRKIASVINSKGNNRDKVNSELSKLLKRSLTEEDEVIICYFLNGL